MRCVSAKRELPCCPQSDRNSGFARAGLNSYHSLARGQRAMSFQWSKAAICLGLALIPSPLKITAQQSEETHTVCDLVGDPRQFDGKSVVVESTIVADLHATILEGPSCGRGIYLSFESKNSPPKWQELRAAVTAKSTGIDKRILRVGVRGVYHGNLKTGSRHIRQLEMTEVQEVQLDGAK
jgi:hypothetical protein